MQINKGDKVQVPGLGRGLGTIPRVGSVRAVKVTRTGGRGRPAIDVTVQGVVKGQFFTWHGRPCQLRPVA